MPRTPQSFRRQCSRPKDNTTELEMVPVSSTSSDTAYYRLIVARKGLFHSDEALLKNHETKWLLFRQEGGEHEKSQRKRRHSRSRVARAALTVAATTAPSFPPSRLAIAIVHRWHNAGAWLRKVAVGPSPSLSSHGSGLLRAPHHRQT
jgi:hypothetical protein